MQKPQTYLPPPELRKFIVEYGVLHNRAGKRDLFFSPPIGLSGFIIQTINQRGEINVMVGEQVFISESHVATGQVTEPVYGEFVDEVKSLLIFFHPLGMYQLFGHDMAKLTDKSLPLSSVVGSRACEELVSRLYDNQNTETQIEVLNNFFSGITPVARDTHKLERVLDYIHHKKGNVTIPELETSGYYHRKTLERHFRKMIGLAPKEYARIYRFKCLINLIQSEGELTWSQMAERAGYYDHSHLSRYVNDYLEVSPNSIVKLDMELIHYLLDK